MNNTFKPTNELESWFEKTFTDAESRLKFFQLLLESDVYVLGQYDEKDDSNDKVGLVTWGSQNGKKFIPFYTSLAALQSKGGDSNKGFAEDYLLGSSPFYQQSWLTKLRYKLKGARGSGVHI